MTAIKWLFGGAVAAAAIFAGYSATKAADLGADGTADLEERVAELEATTARKDNRKVSLKISGYVAHNVMHWDDGSTSDTYIGDGGMNASRFRFTGTAKVSPDLTAGFTYEFGINNNAIGSMNQGGSFKGLKHTPADGGDDLGGAVSLRDSTVWLEHKTIGRIKVGHGSTATDNLILVDTSNAGVIASADPALFNGGFFLNSGKNGVNGGLVPFTWSNVLNQGVSFDTARRNHVAWESPILAGFTVSGAVAESDFWDVALRYAGEFGGFRVAGGLGYAVDNETPTFHGIAGGAPVLPASETKTAVASLSVMHMTSGLFVTAAGGQRETDFGASGLGWSFSTKDAHFWHVIGGIQRNWFGFGATTFYGEFHEAVDMAGFDLVFGANSASLSSKANVMGFGVVQRIDSAAMDLFLGYKNYSADVDANWSSNGGGTFDADLKDFQTVIGGAKISF